MREPGSSIFSADSKVLFVGPNGSGKTTLLYQIAEAVLEKDAIDVAHAREAEAIDHPATSSLID